MVDVSIIIVSYSTRKLLRACLSSVSTRRRELWAETFVVDNASSDGSIEMVSREFPAVRLVRNERNMGFAAANNRVLERAAGRYVVLLNPDTRLGDEALSKMVRFMDATPSAGYCGPRLLNGDGSHQPSARRFPTVLSTAYSMLGLPQRYPQSRHTLDLHLLHGDRDNFRADWLTGACLVVRAECVRQVGGLDEGFFMYFEETDWCRRMAEAGWEGWYVPSAEVVHLGGQSVKLAGDARPFSGDHPVHWVNSSRRYMRRYHGVAGMALSSVIEIILYALIWMRHRWRRCDGSRNKARHASAAIRYLLARVREHDRSEAQAIG